MAFNRRIGEFAAAKADPAGRLVSGEAWEAKRAEFLPTAEDAAYLDGLMVPVKEAGRYAGWIAPPKVGIDNKPGDFEYVQIE